MITHYPLVFAENYFISTSGYVYYKTKENKITPYYKNEHLYLKINGKEYKLMYLMIEYFAYDKISNKRVKVKYNKKNPLFLPLCNITFKDDCIDKTSTSNADKQIIERFKCHAKAVSSNKRCNNSIDKFDVLSVLKKYEFNCKYCGKELGFCKWHLDHVKPLSLGGLNIIENLAPACAFCNLMKGAFAEKEFLMKCLRIVKYNNLI